jgi:phosphate starvation-inducible protein PhoH
VVRHPLVARIIEAYEAYRSPMTRPAPETVKP